MQELEKEKDETAALGGPITVMAIGGGAAIIGANLILIGVTRNQAESIVGVSDSNRGTALIAVGGTGLLVGGGMLLGGGLWLRSRIQKRRVFNRQIEDLERQLEYSAPPSGVASLRIVPSLGRGAYGLGLSGAF